MIQDIYPHKLKNTFIPGLEADASSLVIHFNKDGMILIKSQGKPFPRLSEFKTSPDTLTYLFSMDEDNFFLAEDETVVLPEGTEYKRVREFRKMDVPKKSVSIS